jgi:hypothetical protein
MKTGKILLVALLVLILGASMVPRPVQAIECDDLPWGWWYHPGLLMMCYLFEHFWNCEGDFCCMFPDECS